MDSNHQSDLRSKVRYWHKADILGYRNISSAAAFGVLNEGALFARRTI